MLDENEIEKAIKDALPYGASEDVKEAATEIKQMLERAEKQKQSQQPKLTNNNDENENT